MQNIWRCLLWTCWTTSEFFKLEKLSLQNFQTFCEYIYNYALTEEWMQKPPFLNDIYWGRRWWCQWTWVFCLGHHQCSCHLLSNTKDFFLQELRGESKRIILMCIHSWTPISQKSNHMFWWTCNPNKSVTKLMCAVFIPPCNMTVYWMSYDAC